MTVVGYSESLAQVTPSSELETDGALDIIRVRIRHAGPMSESPQWLHASQPKLKQPRLKKDTKRDSQFKGEREIIGFSQRPHRSAQELAALLGNGV